MADQKPERFPRAAVRWHGRLELETPTLTFAESQYALGALALLGNGRPQAAQLLHELLRKANPTLVPRMD